MGGGFTTDRQALPALTSIRFVAAAMVVLHHYFHFEAGYVGVTFFFVLSGFILAYNYGGRVSTWGERRAFWWARFARIYPTHILTLALAFALFGAKPGPLAANVLLLQSWSPKPSIFFGANSVSWSISNEAFFYAAFPLLLMLPARAVVVWLAGLVAAALAASFLFPGAGTMSEPLHWLFYINPPVRLVEFAVGVLLGQMFTGGAKYGSGAEFAAVALAVVSLAATPFLPAPLALSLGFLPASVAAVWVFAQSRGPIGRIAANPVLIILGEASFALYMVHQLLQRAVTEWFGWGNVIAGVTAVAAVGLSIAVYYGWERPWQRWLRAMGRTARRSPAPSGSSRSSP